MSSKPELTILTLPVSDGPDALQQRLWLAARQLNYWRKRQRPPRYAGHYAVTRSVVEGMAKTGLPVNYNPRRMSEVTDRVHVLGGVQPLRQMIRWKQEGRIRQLTCGPNIVVRSTDYNSLIAAREIDAVLNHAEWVREFWAQEHSELRNRYLSWASGVDETYWKYESTEERKSILIFDKSFTDPFDQRIKPYVQFLEMNGHKVIVLKRKGKNYSGSYTPEQYRTLLHSACLLVGFTVGSETQGIAWAEAWAANVPTLILQQQERWISGLQAECSTAPFLTPATGAFFNDFDDFKQQFELWRGGHHAFRPRDWVLAHMSDEVCARDLYNKLINLPQHLLR